MKKRIFLIVLDSFGIGAMPDSEAFGDVGVNTLASCAASAVVWILHGQVLWALAIPALACSIAGNYLGALYAIRGGSKKIRSVMFLVLGLLFVKMLYELLF